MWNDVALNIILLFSSFLSTISGIGGGPLFLPIFILLEELTIHKSVPLTVTCVFVTCLVRSIYYIFFTKDVDYYLVFLLVPFIISSQFIGIILSDILIFA